MCATPSNTQEEKAVCIECTKQSQGQACMSFDPNLERSFGKCVTIWPFNADTLLHPNDLESKVNEKKPGLKATIKPLKCEKICNVWKPN